ncbi:Bug family tripartite tricarboxylate transporter substrate binding protein [Ideonella paludis]|uniref:Tripartite tricarboxylate transporter substrate binding protein n=1 Tax=Ideonella paludis TaxID=1233411 RepID=A0ABS5E0F2_9BURK|nr:tripartite tricarboxylate transporter substrate-binding protein [Ideonella paludis]MBQ0936888.1 tripartite tricarboxylate transporter substrate binding protein [Ideonella paludis]
MDRRSWVLAGAAGTLLSALGQGAHAQAVATPAAPRAPAPNRPAPTPQPAGPAPVALPLMRIYIPGSAGGGWDQTGRALGAAIQAAGLAQKVEYENKGGKGGTIGLADFVERFSSDPAALLVGGMVMVGAIAASRPKITLAQVTPLARLTSDYMVLVSGATSKIRDLKDLADEMKRDLSSVVFTGGSAGGVDHMLAAMMARQLRLDVSKLKYEPNPGGKEAVAMITSGKATVAISGYSEFKGDIEAKVLTPLAVSSRRKLYGIPSLSEGGIQTDLANWRGVFAAGKISEEQQANLRRIITRATETPQWRQTVADKNWNVATLIGKDFADSLTIEQAMAEAIAMILKLKA